MVTLLAFALAAAVPTIKSQIQRENEIELEHRGNEYVKAIQKYYRKFGRYPSSIEQLENTNNIRFLRKRYKDPITGKDDWRVIHLGEAKYPPKLTGIRAAQVGQNIGQNIGTAVGNSIGTALNNYGGNGAPPNNTAAVNPGANGPGGFGQQVNPANQDSSANGPGGFGQQGSNPALVPGQTPNAGAAGGGNTVGLGSVGQGGQPMIGVAIPVNRASLRVYNDREKYNEWEFIYDPRLEAGNVAFGTPVAQPGAAGGVNGSQTPGQQSNSPFQSGQGANPFQGGAIGNTPTASPMPGPR